MANFIDVAAVSQQEQVQHPDSRRAMQAATVESCLLLTLLYAQNDRDMKALLEDLEVADNAGGAVAVSEVVVTLENFVGFAPAVWL
jgi:hypothetical protein